MDRTLSNDISTDHGESGTYVAGTREHIGHSDHRVWHRINELRVFRTWTENPRVGGSIPPLGYQSRAVLSGTTIRLDRDGACSA